MYDLRIYIHNKINIYVKSRYEFYINHFRKEYPDIFYQNTEKQPSGIKLFIDTDFPIPETGDIYIKERFKGVHSYICLIKNIKEGVIEVYFKTSFTARFLYPSMAAVFIQSEILEPLIYLKALEKDLLMLHASGVFNNMGGYAFAASAGVGKTTMAFHLLLKGFGFLGDDLVFISKEGKLYSYPKRIHFFSYLKDKNPFLNISKDTLAASKTRNMLRKFLRFITKKEFYFSTRIDIRDIMPSVKIGKSVPVNRMFLLKSPSCNNQSENHSKKELQNRIINTCDTRKSLLDNILRNDDNLTQYVIRKEEDIIGKIWSNLGFEEIFIDDVVNGTDKILHIINSGK